MIEPAYAQAQLPLILSMLQHQGMAPDETDHNVVIHSSKKIPTQVAVIGMGVGKVVNALQSAGLFSVKPYTSLDRLPYNSVAQVDITGPILKYGDYCSFGSIDQADLIARLGAHDRVKGILLNIDSPGGQVDGTGTFADTIRSVSKQKPVLAIIQDGMAASCAMWLAAAAQEIYVTRAKDRVGSIGAYCTLYDYSGYFEANGIKVTDIYAPQSEDKNKDYRDAIAGDDSLIKNELKFLVEEFKKDVVAFRGARLNLAAGDPFTGKMYVAKDALKLGLIDGIKPLSWVMARMEQLIALRN